METQVTDTFGRAYGHVPGKPDPVLTQVGPGTPGGELLRRYWQPIALSSEATDLPKEIRRLGEDLILFRNKSGEAGLLYRRCIHRGASLLYGQVEEDGIRCCYHGWKFSCRGKVLEQPCEPERGRAKHKLRQPWYPIVEQNGAIWAYMGPPDKQPLLPTYSCFENLREDEEIVARYVGRNGMPFPSAYNWFQNYENVVDSYHIPMLHTMTGLQFADQRFLIFPEVSWRYSAANDSVIAESRRDLGNGETYVRLEQALIPSAIALPPFFGDGPGPDVWFYVPYDDTSYVHIQITRQPKDFKPELKQGFGYTPENKQWRDLTPEEHQRYPTDYEAQSGQGQITLHSEENLAYSDGGLAKLRLHWKRQARIVQEGGNPIGVAFKEEDRRIVIEAASWVEKEHHPKLEIQKELADV